jgi:hypothetical protein
MQAQKERPRRPLPSLGGSPANRWALHRSGTSYELRTDSCISPPIEPLLLDDGIGETMGNPDGLRGGSCESLTHTGQR